MKREMRGCRARKGTPQPIKALALKLGCKDATVWSLLKASAVNWMAHKDARLGAALAYYSIFSLGPITIIAMAVAGLFFGRDVVEGEVSAAMRGLLGETGAQGVQTMLAGASKPTEGLVATLIGTGALLFAAIGVVVQLKDALNTVWEVEPSKQSGVWHFVRTYMLSLAAVIAVGFLLLVSLLLTAAVAALGKMFAGSVPEGLLQPLGSLASFVIVAALFAMMFKWLPDTPVEWRDVWLGAVVTALLFEIGKFAIGFYIGKQGLESSFGAAASLVIVLIWVYYSAQILLMGAEFTRAHALQRHPESQKEVASSAS
jgi:membrane protein